MPYSKRNHIMTNIISFSVTMMDRFHVLCQKKIENKLYTDSTPFYINEHLFQPIMYIITIQGLVKGLSSEFLRLKRLLNKE
jgi:hypothetical protein